MSLLFGQDSIELTGSFDSRVFISENRLPFWMFTNTQGFLGQTSDYGVSVFAKAKYKLSDNSSLSTGLGAYSSDGFNDDVRRKDIYIDYINKWFQVSLGAKSEPITMSGLSTINDNILFTGNARPIPGIILSNSNSIPLSTKFSLDAELAHYNLNDTRRTEGARIHYKMLGINWQISDKSFFSVALRHYVQWGGTLEDGTKLPEDLNAFVRVFAGANGGNIDNPNEAINALGNHLGSYKVDYFRQLKTGTLNIYHQSLFDDRSGRELNNFPDGVWGIHLDLKEDNLIKEVVYEYIQTVSQSGRPRATVGGNQQSGGDNYFRNGIYPSGWTYEGAIIGLPFINPFGNTTTPGNNRMIGHHFGIAGSFKSVDFKIKATYVQNLGTYGSPIEPRQKALYGYGELAYSTENYGIFTLYGAADYLNDFSNAASVGIGYRFELN